MRGSRVQPADLARPPRSIPARAGEPGAPAAGRPFFPVHPRACGGALNAATRRALARGPSPRVRGSRARRRKPHPGGRSIPARAGEPPTHGRIVAWATVHPRACGGARPPERRAGGGEGPSPRVRGSPWSVGFQGAVWRSIPARAGEPSARRRGSFHTRVHPRACGGAHWHRGSGLGDTGPSPRVRGSPEQHHGDGERHGSIPARAGEPAPRSRRSLWTRVHPRACGGAAPTCTYWGSLKGPSPRVRGSRPPRRTQKCMSGVHPRACGGAATNPATVALANGPSPRVRGSHG